MNRQPYDYSGFSLRRLNEPRFAHAKLLGGWIGYFILYFITENLIPASRCHPIHCALDDLIPFNEAFLFFYVGWYVLVAGSLAYTFFYNVPAFRKLQTFIMITQAVAMLCYILWPSRQDLRPEVFPRENLLTALMGFIYSFDTSTGVCPSLHVLCAGRLRRRLLCQAALRRGCPRRPAGMPSCGGAGLRQRLLAPPVEKIPRPRIEYSRLFCKEGIA